MNHYGTLINFNYSPSFDEVRELANQYFILRNVASPGFYSIVLELTPNGKVNTHLPHLK